MHDVRDVFSPLYEVLGVLTPRTPPGSAPGEGGLTGWEGNHSIILLLF